VPDWTPIHGVRSFTISTTKNDIDTRDFDSGGWLEHIVGSRGKSFTVAGARIEDEDTGDRDPGQEAIETLGDELGADAIGSFRITTPGGTTYIFGASADVTPFGGGLDAFADWSVGLTMTGQWTVA
jgi:predicted secreted protein